MYVMLNATSVLAVLFLVFLEGVLSVDNALVLALMVRGLPPERRSRALVYGVWGAMGFRAVALLCLTWLIQLTWVKFLGGGYLVGMSLAHFIRGEDKRPESRSSAFTFWRTVLMIELVDIAFSADSILASLSVSGNYWILLAGGLLGIATMRVAARAFVWLVETFPRMETTAYLLVLVMGTKLLAQGAFESVDFHSVESPAAWLFWAAAGASVFYGLVQRRGVAHAAGA